MQAVYSNFQRNRGRPAPPPYLVSAGQRDDKNERLVCKLDRDLADSLDDCDIQGRCRSDLVNAIVRAIFGAFLPQLARYRREKKSHFTNYKEA